MRVIIVEDEIHAAEKLQRQLNKISNNIEVLAKIESVESAVNWLKGNDTDLIFLDIHLGDSNSFQIFEQVEIKTPVIFTTAYDQYAIKAFKLNAIDYLLKPIDQKELVKAIAKFEDVYQFSYAIDYGKIANILQEKSPESQKRFLVYSGDKIKMIEVDMVAYFMAEGKYCYLNSNDNQQYLVDFTLDKLEKVLDPDQFFRINRQFIVNIKGIKQMHSYPKGRVKIDLSPPSRKEAIVSIERASQFKKWLNK